jgi:hypothetical protein
MEQWVTTTDELSAGGRYASLTEGAAYRSPVHSSSISSVAGRRLGVDSKLNCFSLHS